MKFNEFDSQVWNSNISLSRRHYGYACSDTSLWTISLLFLILFQNFVNYDKIERPTLLSINKLFDVYVVPLYTVGVLIYLALVYLHYDIPFITKQKTSNQLLHPSKQQHQNETVAVSDQSVSQSSTTNSASKHPDNALIFPEENSVDSIYEVEDKNAHMPVNLSGLYILLSNHNVEAFLEAQGVPWALRRAASSARPMHRINHQGNSITIQIEAGGSGAFAFKSQTTYIINGPPVETDVRGRIFHDRVTYLYDDIHEGELGNNDRRCKGIFVSKRCDEENYTVSVKRELSDDNQRITLTSTANFAPELNKIPVVGQQIFERVE